MKFWIRGACLLSAVSFAGCASLPADHGYAATADLVDSRLGTRPQWTFEHEPTSDASNASSTEPIEGLTAAQAVNLALARSPRVREIEARLGLGRAELEAARRIGNPAFGYSELSARDGGGKQITRSVTLGLTDLLMLGARKRVAAGELDREGQLAADELLQFAADVEVAWYEAVAGARLAAVRETIAQSAANSADLARRFLAAGNLTPLQFERERAAAAEQRIEATRAAAAAKRLRGELAALIGLPVQANWSTSDELPPFTTAQWQVDELVDLALEQRLDLAAARRSVSLREDALGITNRWRWLGAVEFGYEHESDIDGSVIRGPSLSIELPIFNQGQGALTAAQAELLASRARLDALTMQVEREASLGVDALDAARAIAEQYRSELVPSREAIVASTQEQVNFMLLGVFDLLSAKHDEYDAYQGYIEATRDYWVAHTRLRQMVGGRLPDDGEPPADHHQHGATP